ncbi:hypothetical protein GT043_09540, partial [Streptomyces sp. SID2131]|nr:hypothetical protein [Streptomyces sp. SID2131]
MREPTRPEGPTDLRLVPLAAAAWAAAACAVGVTGWWTVAGVAVCLVGAAVLSAWGVVRRRGDPAKSRGAVVPGVATGRRLRATAW